MCRCNGDAHRSPRRTPVPYSWTAPANCPAPPRSLGAATTLGALDTLDMKPLPCANMLGLLVPYFPLSDIVDPPGYAYGLWREEACNAGPSGDPSRRLPNEWMAPVDLQYGNKLEDAVDLVLPLSSGEYRLTRTYRSGPGWTPEPLSGTGWTLSAFIRAKEFPEDDEGPLAGTVQLGSNTGRQPIGSETRRHFGTRQRSRRTWKAIPRSLRDWLRSTSMRAPARWRQS